MQRARPAERNQREEARILALFLQCKTQVNGHVGIDDADDTGGGLQRVHAERRAGALERGACGRLIQPKVPASSVPLDSAPSSKLASVTVASVPPRP